MKFEANIPSYLRTGAGVFPVKDKPMPKRMESSNFYEMAKQGFDMPVANETKMPAFAPVGDFERGEPMDNENFLDKMQMNMENKGMMMAGGRKPLPGQQTLPGDFPTTGELNDREAAESYKDQDLDDELPDNVKEIDIFIG
jgi:hypothetical protein